jgi:threonine dehydratase
LTRAVRRPGPADVAAAREVIRSWLQPTPVQLAAPGLALKLESMQPTGSFKVRGALNAVAALDPGTDVVTASAGNHGLGVAYAAAQLGRKATVVVPETASPAKVAALREFPVRLIQVGSGYDDAEAHALELASRGAYYLSAYNDPLVIAGQGTIGYELASQVDGPMTVVCPVGGGGLASGLSLWAAGRDQTRVVAVEADRVIAVSAAIQAGHQVDVEVGETIADGVGGNIEPGSVTADVLRECGTTMITVTEAEIRSAIRYLASSCGLVTEGAGAISVAAARAGKVAAEGQLVAVVTGRNIARPVLADVLNEND